jgi:hypothetical protein
MLDLEATLLKIGYPFAGIKGKPTNLIKIVSTDSRYTDFDCKAITTALVRGADKFVVLTNSLCVFVAL